MSPTRGTRLIADFCQVSLDLFRYETESLRRGKGKSRKQRQIDVPRTGDSTWSLRDSKRGFIYPYYATYPSTRRSPRPESSRPQAVTSYTVISHATSCYVTLCHATSYKSRISCHCKPPICVWAPVSPPSYPRPVSPPRRSWSR